MKKILAFISCILLIGIFMGSCRRTSDNGLIDGHWRVMSVEHIKGDVYDTDTVIHPKTVYFAIQLELCQVYKYASTGITQGEGANYTSIIDYDRKGKKLALEFPMNNTFSGWMLECGITGNPVTYNVEVNSKHLVLKNNDVVITCRRY